MSEPGDHCDQDMFERDIILDELRRTLQFAATDEQQFRSRAKDLISQQRKFSKLQTKIEKYLIKLKSFNKEEQIKIRNDFNDTYYAIVTYQNKLKKEDEDCRRASRPIISHIQRSTNNLPTLPLPSFNGETTDWPAYYDLFRSLVHSNGAYTDAEKFRYLLLTLKNEPYNLIKSIPITDDNYLVALEILVSRYENKRAIAAKHLDKIFDIPSCSENTTQNLRDLLNIYQENIKALEMMQFPTHQWSFLLLHILLRKIPMSIRKRFELSLANPSEVPDVTLLVKFLDRELSANDISSCGQFKNSFNNGGSRFAHGNTRGNASAAADRIRRSFTAKVTSGNDSNDIQPYSSSNNIKNCLCCNAQHSLSKCSRFLNMSPRDRYNFIQNKNICINCLNVGHGISQCNSNFVCRTCHRRHHSLVHFSTQSLPVISDSNAVSLPPTEELGTSNNADTQHVMTSVNHAFPEVSAISNTPFVQSTVLLSTALIDVHVSNQLRSTVRCIIDTGSQATFITEACAQRLGLARRHVNIPVYGIGDNKPVRPRGIAACSITPKGAVQPSIPVDALILPKLISHMPSVPLPYTGWPHIRNLQLADPNFYTPQPVEMLLGADILSHIALGNVITGLPGSPIAMHSIFGYLLLGKLEFNTPNVPTSLQVCLSSLNNDFDLQRFWELESMPEQRSLTANELLCESIFENTHRRDDTGRYVVALPFKPDAPPLGESRQIALSRFRKLEYRLEQKPQLKADYHACLQEYLDLNHMELVDSAASSSPSYYIPHHCVVKESSQTTRTRVVFDAGCKSSSGVSLNDVLLTGQKLHPDIVEVLLKFRVHNVAFTADIKQMYRNILLQDSDRDYQRILWRSSPEEPIRDYRLRTVTFGISASPFLALRTIRQLARDEATSFPHGSRTLLNEVFVDDVVSGESTETRALSLQEELVGICRSAGFELRKWHSNSPAILAAVLPLESHGERGENVTFAEMENDVQVKVLGLQWNPSSDLFTFSVRVLSEKCTKRTILSEVARIYDPMGFVSPVTLYAKHLIQLLWLARVDWDDTPPMDIMNSWSCFVNELPLLSQISFPRHVFIPSESIQIHGFADASEKAYSACVYIRLTDKSGKVHTNLLLSKTRVAPTKGSLTIPRLELMAALLLSRLMEKIMLAYGNYVSRDNIYAWSDSSIVLAWLRSSSHEWKTFVSNRIHEIQTQLPATCWRHVPSADNPADAASRGMLPGAFLRNHIWFHGPSWLRHDVSSWPVSRDIPDTTEEIRNLPVISTLSTASVPEDVEIVSRFSSLGKLVRVTALIFRFYQKCKNNKILFPPHVTVCEYNFALNRLIHVVQQSVFKTDIQNISNGKSPSNQLKRLNPFIDSENLLRVGGRIHKSLLPYESKHQLILPKKHSLTILLINDVHIVHLHAGTQSTQYTLLQKYWILSGRDIIRKCIHRCVRCFRARPARPQPHMAPLPAVRLKPERPFLKTAVDFAGPFYVRANKVRNAKIVKCYVAVFVCMCVKAIHLEIVSELSTEAFLATLRRFTSRRGLCTDIYSDCGKNFVGCNNYLKELYQFLNSDAVQSSLNSKILRQGITWHFQPPYASHFGGLFEAGVKSFKHHLHRVVGTRTLSYDEMHTLLCQIEAVLNSRPLCVLSSDSTDPLPLTPSHFLIGAPLTAIPDVSLAEDNPSRLNRWRLIQQTIQHFWKRWSVEYLHEIQQRNKWFSDRGSPLREGTIVVVCDENLPPLQWRLARVHALHPGTDNVTRVVTLQIGRTFLKRPVVKICPLPLE